MRIEEPQPAPESPLKLFLTIGGIVIALCVCFAIVASVTSNGQKSGASTARTIATEKAKATATTQLVNAVATETPQPKPADAPKSYPTNAPILAPTNISEPTNTPQPTATKVPPSATPVPTDTPVPTNTPAPLVLSGRGQQASQKFSLSAGLGIFHMKHDGQRNIIITLMDSGGKDIDLLVNRIGPFDGSKALGITKAGEYIFYISADGNWSVAIEQPVITSAPKAPQTFTGRGAKVTGPFSLSSGLVTFRMTHNGKRNFIVTLLDNKGSLKALLTNVIGAFDGSKAQGVSPAGVYVLDIEADGEWTVKVEQ